MSEDQPTDAAATSAAAAYDRGQPGYPAAAVQWLLGPDPRIVLELGAGTGKLTAEMVRQGHAVHATDPDEAMLALLQERVPECSARQAPAEEIPANDRSVDVVVVGQSFDRFDHDRALAEIARVLRPGGHVAVVHNERDQRIPWVRRLSALLGDQDHDLAPSALVTSELFGFVEDTSFKHWHDVNRDSIVDLARSCSTIAPLGDDEREDRVAEVLAFYDDFGRGMDGMQIPLVARCFRATVTDRRESPGQPAAEPDPEAGTDGPITSDGSDTDMLLIDFR